MRNLLLPFAATALVAQPQPRLALPLLSQAPSMARNTDLSSWAGAARIDAFHLHQPDDQGTIPHRTVAHLAWAQDGLYVAVEAGDPRPDQVRAWPAKRDELGEQDLVILDLDPSGSSQSAIRFFVSALGDQAEGLASEMTMHGDDVSYDALWESVGLRTPTGYLVKIRIPFSSLRRAPGEWGVRIQRRIPRERPYAVAWPRQRREERCELCQMARVAGAPAEHAGSPFLVIPFASLHREASLERGSLGDPRTLGRGGVDLRYAGRAVTLDATYRPDFSSVEADVDPLQVNSRFKVAYPEKRPFFLEGMELFALSGAQRQFFSRAIADPLYGVKASGSGSRMSWSALLAQDLGGGLGLASDGARGTEALASRDMAVTARLRLDDRGSNLAVLGTDRLLLGGPVRSGGSSGGLYVNQLLGSSFRIVASRIQAEATLPGEEGARSRRGTATAASVSYSDRNLYLDVSGSATSPDLVLPSGFTDLTGFRRAGFSGGFFAKWNEGPIAEVEAFLDVSRFTWWDGSPMERTSSLVLALETAGRLKAELILEPGGRSWAQGRSVGTRGLGFELGWWRHAAFQPYVRVVRSRVADLETGEPAASLSAYASASGHISGVTYSVSATDKRLEAEAGGALILRARQVQAGLGLRFLHHLYLKAQAYLTRYDAPSGESLDRYGKLLAGWQPNAFTHAYVGYSTRRRRDPLERLEREQTTERGLFAKLAYALQF